MPYIQKYLRAQVDDAIKELIECMKTEVNIETGSTVWSSDKTLAKYITYSFYKILSSFYKNGDWYLMGDVDKILESVKDEFHRNYIHPHEDEAKKKNGDVI